MIPKKNKVYALIKADNSCISKTIFKMPIDKTIHAEKLTSKILEKLKPQDTLLVEDILYLGDSVSEVVMTLKEVAQYNINLCLVQENLSFKADRLTEIASSLLLVFKLHQSLISLRAKNALQERKGRGLKLGRPYGTNPALKLDDHKDEIQKLLLAGTSKNTIAEQYQVCRTTVYNFVRKNPELLLDEV